MVDKNTVIVVGDLTGFESVGFSARTTIGALLAVGYLSLDVDDNLIWTGPTVDPAVLGAVYSDSGVLTVSAGP